MGSLIPRIEYRIILSKCGISDVKFKFGDFANRGKVLAAMINFNSLLYSI